MLPGHLTSEIPAPKQILQDDRGLLELLAQYEALRRRANADRATTLSIMGGERGVDDE